MPESTAPSNRIVSLDQFRGYAVLGMFLVNFVGGFTACNYVLKHHNTFCSYADTVMPQFLFAVGFAFRLTFGRRECAQGAAAAYARVVRRLLGLVLISLVIYTVGPAADTWDRLEEIGLWGAIREPLKRDWFQTLMHIAVTSLWILPVVRAQAGIRIAYMAASAAIHVYLSHRFYFLWVNGQLDGINGIDGGPLGFLTWSVPMIVGTLACDAIANADGRPRLGVLSVAAVTLMVLGYLFSCGTTFYDVPVDKVEAQASQKFAAHPVVPSTDQIRAARMKIEEGRWKELLAEPPFVPPPHPAGKIGDSHVLRKWNYWMMSQRGGTLSYLTFSAGFSLAVYLLFHVCCDIFRWQLGVFRTFGTNALAAYVLHGLVASAIKPFMPRDVPAWYMWAGCALFMVVTYVIVRSLEKQHIFIRL